MEQILKNFHKTLEYQGRILEIPGKHVWGTSIVCSDDGKYHAYYSFWSENDPHEAWVINCRIGHAVATKITGPYKEIGVALQGTGGHEWDSWSIHNPSVTKIDKQYVMVYMGNSGETINHSQQEVAQTIKKLEKTGQFGPSADYWNKPGLDPQIAKTFWYDYDALVGQKRTGMAIATNPEGPWCRVSRFHPRVTRGERGQWDDFVASNPSLIKNHLGQYVIYYKSWDHRSNYQDFTNPTGGNRKYGIAIADKLTGPYKKYEENPILDYSHLRAQIEDANVFYYQNNYFMICRDMGIKDNVRGIILGSKDGIKWSEPRTAYGPVCDYVPEPLYGLKPREGNFERPQVVVEKGTPTYLVVAARGGKYRTSSAAVFKINWSKIS